MLIGLCGAICAGKQSVANYLVQAYGFRELRLHCEHNVDVSNGIVKSNRNDNETEVSFHNVQELDDFVSKRWQELWIVKDLQSEATLDLLLRRPYFLLLSVDAPVSVRWRRYKSREQSMKDAIPTLEQFVLDNDEHLYNPKSGLAHLIGRAQLRLLNSSSSIAELHGSLASLDLINEQRLRPSWDQYFMELASLAAQRSNCMRRRVGCVIVRDKRVISTGYNGTPRNMTNCNQGGCPRCNGGVGGGASLSTCLCMHAEENALLEAGRDRIRDGAILYCDTCPCLTCSIKIVQVGITEVVYSQSYHMDVSTAKVFKEAGVHLRQFSPPRNGLVDLSADIRREVDAKQVHVSR